MFGEFLVSSPFLAVLSVATRSNISPKGNPEVLSALHDGNEVNGAQRGKQKTRATARASGTRFWVGSGSGENSPFSSIACIGEHPSEGGSHLWGPTVGLCPLLRIYGHKKFFRFLYIHFGGFYEKFTI